MFYTNPSHFSLRAIGFVFALLIVLINPASADDEKLINALVPASLGGTFSDDPDNPSITVTIPAGALNMDARLIVKRAEDDDDDDEDEDRDDDKRASNQTPASAVYKIRLKKQGKGKRPRGKPQLNQPMTLAITADVAPIHPQIGEIAVKVRDNWKRLPANFHRPSGNTVVSLTQRTQGKFQVVHRTLKSVSGPGVTSGRNVFMYETFGNENFFGGVLGLHTLLNQVPPAAAVSLGAQVDINKVPASIVEVMVGDDLAAKATALNNPAVTRALIKAGAVIGVKGVYASDDPADDTMISAGLTCALCHVNATTTEFTLAGDTGPAQVALPIGQPRFDGVPNTAMNAGAILALTPFAQNAGQDVVDFLNSWGPGRFDVRSLPDNVLEDGVANPTEYPPIWNFVDLENHGYTIGWDGLFLSQDKNFNGLASISEAVYDLIMHGNGAFATANGTLPPELSITPPQALVDALVAAEDAQPGNDIQPAQKLFDIRDFMRSITSPAPGTFDEARAEAGFMLFNGEAGCSQCHSNPEFSGPGLFTNITANAPAGGLAGGIHVPGLRGIKHTAPYFHDGSETTLSDVINRYIANGNAPAMSDTQKTDLVEYLNSL